MNERTQTANVSNWLWGAMSRNPEGLLLLAAGGVLLMRKGAPSRTETGVERATHAYDADRRSGADQFSLVDRAGSAAESIGAFTSNYAQEARRTASEGLHQAQTTFQTGLDRVLHDQPLMVALGGLAAGAVVAAVLPGSNFEKQTLGPLREQINEEALRVGDRLKETASKAAGTLKTAVQEQSLGSDGLKKTASDVTEVIRDSMPGETQRQAPKPGPSGPGDRDRGE
jgi:hypothetical protein